ncbi:MAG: hypothetical protein Q8Q52_05255 [Acidimicrobiia bacterium]|nr:hypothetical protein [Acidimicrobiia bacterium]
MDRAQVDQILSRCEQVLAAGGEIDLAGLGFWKAVTGIKRQPEWVDDYAERVGRIDREAFERWALVKVGVGGGTAVMVVGTIVGLVLIGLAYGYDGFLQAGSLLVGTGILLVTTHGLAHQIVGAAQGMRFSHWFVGTITRPQPGVKIDYATYLRVPPLGRAWMHASGAITTKFIPLVGLGAGWAMDADVWVLGLLALLTVVQIATDVLWSTKASDWKKYRREMALVR